MELSHSGVVCITKREKAESEAQRGKPKGTLEWCGSVVIDRRGDQLGKVLVCFHAVTIQHRGRATRSIDQREREMLMFIKRDTRMATAYARILLHIAFLFYFFVGTWRRERMEG